MALTEFFDDFGSIVTARWTALTAGSGTVTASGSMAILDEGGTADGDVAALALDEPLDFTKSWVLRMRFKVEGATTAAHSPNLIGIYDFSGAPAVGTQAQQNTAHRLFWENQMNTTTPSNSRMQARFKNPSAAIYTWRDTLKDWDPAFAHSLTFAPVNGFMTLVLVHKVGSGLRVVAYGRDAQLSDGTSDDGARLGCSSKFVDFGAAATDIDAIDNSAYLVIGDIANDAGGYDHTLTVEYAAFHELTGPKEEFGFSAGTTTPGTGYDIYDYLCPAGAVNSGHQFWVPADHHPDDNVGISRGGDDFAQNVFVYRHTTGVEYAVYSRKVDANTGHISIRSRATPTSAWSAATIIISENDTGLDAAVTQLRFPEILYDADEAAWFLFFNSETATGTPMKGWRAKSTNADPTVDAAWGSITEIIAPTGVVDDFDEDGVAGLIVIRYDVGVYLMFYSGLDSSLDGGSWQIGFATATSIEGTWTRGNGGNPIIPKSSLSTQINGASQTGPQYTVDSTTGFSAGDFVTVGVQNGSGQTQFRPAQILSIDDAVTLTLYERLNTADGHFIVPIDADSNHTSLLRRRPEGGGWELWATPFKYNGGEESICRYVSTGDDNPSLATWAVDRGKDFPPLGMMRRSSQEFGSEENFAAILDAGDIIQALGGAGNPNLRALGAGLLSAGRPGPHALLPWPGSGVKLP